MAVVDEVLNDEAEFPLFGWVPTESEVETCVRLYVLIAEGIDVITEHVELDVVRQVES